MNGADTTFLSILRFLWGGRRIIFATVCVCVLIGLVYAAFAPRVYRAAMFLYPSNTGSQPNLPGGMSLASSLIGLGTPGQSPNFDKFVALLDSQGLAERLLARKDVVPYIYDARWDPQANAWVRNGVFSAIARAIGGLFGETGSQEITASDLLVYMQDNLVQRPNPDTNVLEIDAYSTDREFARNFLAIVHREADNMVRLAARARTTARIRYLEGALPKVTMVEERDDLIAQLSTEERSMMMIAADSDYAADIVDDAHAGVRPVWPMTALVVFVALVFGFFLGIALTYLDNMFSIFGRIEKTLPARLRRRAAS